MTYPPNALQKLIEGNKRFIAGKSADIHRTHKLLPDQYPFAIVIGCSDSRVPPEIIFDQGVGDMFVIRVAGNIITPLELGSVEFAALKFGPRLVIVMGHTKCGAVQSTIETVQAAPSPSQASQTPGLSQGMQIIVEQISSSVDTSCPCEQLSDQTIRANIANSVQKLRTESQVLIDLKKDEGFMTVGALYHIETGEVEFTDIPEHNHPNPNQ
ncbi:MAG: carbonic anhydrase [Phycisphaerales bacterium]